MFSCCPPRPAHCPLPTVHRPLNSVLEVINLTKSYPAPRGPLLVLAGVNLTLAEGEAAAIMGPSGSGKSTLLYILGALEPPTSGQVVLNGRQPFDLPAAELAAFRNRQIGFVFQDHALLPQCTVLENVLVPTLVGGADGEARAFATQLIEQVGLRDRIDHRPSELSGGEKQRAALARARVRRPRLVWCDEPTGNLDRTSADLVADLLLDLHARQRSVLVVVTHSARLADRFPRRFALGDRVLMEVG
ncbi:MAG: ATP-binding cassette domain-containing protein [Acidobacteria bacterium]|nr:ATP-binding cassette domain-containing protein [Acidobacteriota bacterium]